MKAPIRSASGKIAGLKAGYHARTNKITGRVTIVRTGNTNPNPPSPKQIACRARFAEMAKQPRKKGSSRELREAGRGRDSP